MEEHADDVPAAAPRGGSGGAAKKVDDSLLISQMVAEGWLEHNEE